MTLFLTPPVGTPIPGFDTQTERQEVGLNTPAYLFLQSGTAALAFALIVANKANPNRTEVILPAYGCPDLVAAALYAGLKAVIVDVQSAPYQYCSEALQESVNDNTLAIVLPTLLGIRMPTEPIQCFRANGIIIIEDNAQWLPTPNVNTDATRLFDSSFDSIDLSLISFGRGKPVNLLGGGAVFLHNSQLKNFFDQVVKQFNFEENEPFIDNRKPSIGFRLKAHAFNLLCHPLAYGLVSKLPYLSLGQTVFHTLNGIERLDSDREGMITSAISAYRDLPTDKEARLRKAISQKDLLTGNNNRLLRYPLICASKAARESLFDKLIDAGIGVSKFYDSLLMEIEGVDSKVIIYTPVEKAKIYSEQLITLPLHAGITDQHVDTILNITDQHKSLLTL